MPHELALQLDHHHVMAVEGSDDLWRLVVGEPAQLVFEIDGMCHPTILRFVPTWSQWSQRG